MAVYSRDSVAVFDASAPQTPSASFSLQRLLWRWGSERLLWTILAIAVFVVAIVPLIYTVDAAFYRETRTGLASDRSLNAFLKGFGVHALQHRARFGCSAPRGLHSPAAAFRSGGLLPARW